MKSSPAAGGTVFKVSRVMEQQSTTPAEWDIADAGEEKGWPDRVAVRSATSEHCLGHWKVSEPCFGLREVGLQVLRQICGLFGHQVNGMICGWDWSGVGALPWP